VLLPISSSDSEGKKGMVPPDVDREVEFQVTGSTPTPTCSDSSSGPGVVNVDSAGDIVVPNLCLRDQLRNASL